MAAPRDLDRFEAGEHADAVDGAAARLGLDTRTGVGRQMGRMITLANGEQVSQGEITAMMVTSTAPTPAARMAGSTSITACCSM